MSGRKNQTPTDDTEDQRHIIPPEAEIDHEASANCWCQPEIVNEDEVEAGLAVPLWMHRRRPQN